jgi:hypothetical protein
MFAIIAPRITKTKFVLWHLQLHHKDTTLELNFSPSLCCIVAMTELDLAKKKVSWWGNNMP